MITKQHAEADHASLDFKKVAVLVGMAKGAECNELLALVARRNGHHGGQRQIVAGVDWPELESVAARFAPQAVVLDESVLPPDVSLTDAARRLASFAPVVAIAPSQKQSDLINAIATGEVDFVARSGDFISVAAAFVERHLRSPRRLDWEFRSAWAADLPSDFAELLRHEINNPLTGILGNAELLLSQLRGNLTPVSVQRLETVVDLAVRLRETIRCLSSEWERQHSSLRSA
ncbi:MAG: histidine kinase dimerization/phospho-acceptor domain-containing protein [Candidatus Acidiferrales bacterium]